MSPRKLVPAANVVDMGNYPVPLASHEDVVKDQTLFINTLRSFHFAMGSKFQIPVIGGKELNLHVLYVEVTKRGGYDKVVTEKKWREISSVFDFSPTTTSASYALRKHYSTLLLHYEHVYFFTIQTGTPLRAMGTIDGKFDCGYLVSVKIGDETLNGVLYHPGYPGSSDSIPPPYTAVVPSYAPRFNLPGRRTRRKRGGDPTRPKPNLSGYNFFFAEKHSMLKSLYPNREREFTKMIGEAWNNLSPEERVVYQSYGLKDKERYQKEMKEYNERVKTGGQQC
ncbi:hypothetical protein CASFOL_016016 [Castilleja foliolosa]|uniref:High mobility group B protein 9 n=1 Tax=Castilleja foliolosa TaxID=1961234 RepID=A0ABD3DFR9_9LAMI